jgi:multisubunit Na+/H+ antiporter MnhG subunit
MAQLLCPRCRQSVPASDLWKYSPITYGAPFLSGSIALLCPHCQARLRVSQNVLVGTAIGALALFGAALSASRGSAAFWVVAALFVLTFLLLQSPLGARLLRLGIADDAFRPTSSVAALLETSQEAAVRLQRSGNSVEPWRCERCGGSNDVIFAICPRCDSRRWPGA